MIQAEKQFGDLLLRTCHSVDDMRSALRLQRTVWNFSDEELVPVRLFVVGEKVGGHVLGAFDGGEMVGFAYGIPGYRAGHSYLHSHMLGVLEEYRNTGVGRALKLFQREIAMQQGFELIEWTFDPLEIKNAYLNIERLGAITRRYTLNQYGITTSPLQAGLPTDRLYAEWWLNSNRVRSLLQTGHKPAVKTEVAIEVPADIYAWKSAKDPRAIELQSDNREQFLKHFKNGLAVLAYERDAAGNGRFLLGHWDEKLGYS
ncbi:MAG TPA: GNAT family N-acetyltransferase [Terriglobales bacterium]